MRSNNANNFLKIQFKFFLQLEMSWMFFILLLIVFFPLINFAESSLKCLRLENISMGCVPSTDHSCFRNKKLDDKGECTFGRDWDHTYRVEGPISFLCQTSTSSTICQPPVVTPDGTTNNCQTVSNCTVYAPPSCHEECIGCYQHRITAYIGRLVGCVVCTRPYCPDEPPPNGYCPANYNGMPLVSGRIPLCTVPSHCPDRIRDPLGNVQPVTIIRGACPPEPPPLEEGSALRHCPWLVDERTSSGCEPIRPGNQNPLAEH